jgi:hypothetical protein
MRSSTSFSTDAAHAAAGASPELVGALSKKIGGAPEQAELTAKAVPILTSFVTKSGGANVGNLLASVLK